MAIVALKSNDSAFNLFQSFSCDWNSPCVFVSDEEKEEEEHERFYKELNVKIDIQDFTKTVGWHLVQYGPIHVIGLAKQKLEQTLKKERTKIEKRTVSLRTIPEVAQPKIYQSSIVDQSPKMHLCEAVRKICPPREWISRGLKMRQYVSCQIASRRDTIALKRKLDKEIEKRKETMTDDGMCLERRQLTASIFDELIRQVTVSCLERGQLLLKIRDEMYSTFRSYETMFNSLVAHKINRILSSKKNIEDLEENIVKVKQKILELEDVRADLQPALLFMENKCQSQFNEDTTVFEEEQERLLKINASLKKILLTVVQKSRDQEVNPI